MSPKTIAVEDVFAKFVNTFRGGADLSTFVKKIPPNALNADYYFPDDDVIAELKTLESDAFDLAVLERRIMAAYKWLGYDLEDYVSWLTGKNYFPNDVSDRLFSVISRPIMDCVRKASKQIVSSRRILGRTQAKGLILIANSGNFGFEPQQLMNVILKGFERLKSSENDAIIYFTPNVYHTLNDGIAYEIWVPIANEGGPKLQTFIDDIGKAWFDYRDDTDRVDAKRQSSDDFSHLLGAKVIRDLF